MWSQRGQGWVSRDGLRLSGQMSILLTAIQSKLNCECYPWTSLLIRWVALLPASAQVYLPNILNRLVFHADKGAMVKETPVAMTVFVSWMHKIHLSDSFQTHSNRSPSDSCGPYKPKNAVGTWRNEEGMAIWPGTGGVCTHTATYTCIKWNQKLASSMSSLDNEDVNPHMQEFQPAVGLK